MIRSFEIMITEGVHGNDPKFYDSKVRADCRPRSGGFCPKGAV